MEMVVMRVCGEENVRWGNHMIVPCTSHIRINRHYQEKRSVLSLQHARSTRGDINRYTEMNALERKAGEGIINGRNQRKGDRGLVCNIPVI
jgi:hypothetical protein